jgi:hypothetical protein
MYQILKLELEHNHAYPNFTSINCFFLKENNAIEHVKTLSKNYLGITFNHVIAEDEDGKQIKGDVFYDIKDCYKVVKITPLDHKDNLPF